MLKLSRWSIFLALLVLVSCTGQKPADIKNPQTFRQKINESCSNLVWDGKILTKKNLINIFSCTGWDKQYPSLNEGLVKITDQELDILLTPFNETYLKTKTQRKKLMQVFSGAEQRGELSEMGKILEKLFSQYNILSISKDIIGHSEMSYSEKGSLLRFASDSNEKNIRNLETIIRILRSLERHEGDLKRILQTVSSEKNMDRLIIFFDELLSQMSTEDWEDLSKIIFDDKNESDLQNWAIASLKGNPEILINILINPDFKKDVSRLNLAIRDGVSCKNEANSSPFQVDVAGELKQVIESLKTDDQKRMEEVLLHGLTKYLAFQEFCYEKREKQGLDSFQNVLKYAMTVLDSEADFQFIRQLHLKFGVSDFKFLSFLSTNSFKELINQLGDLHQNHVEVDFVETLFQILAVQEKNDLKQLSQITSELSREGSDEKEWLNLALRYWKSLSTQQKKQVVEIISLSIDEDIKLVSLFEFIRKLLIVFPDASSSLDSHLRDEKNLFNLESVIDKLNREDIKNDLSKFLSHNGIFELIRVMTKEKNTTNYGPLNLGTNLPTAVTLVERPEIRNPSQTRICFDQLNDSYQLNTSYYQVVNELPESCRSVLGQAGFVGQIYLWMYSSHHDFIQRFGVNDFHSAQSVWSPGMLHFIFSAAVQANLTLASTRGERGIGSNISEIHRVLTDPLLVDVISSFSRVFGYAHNHINLDKVISDYVSSRENQDLTRMSDSLFEFIKPAQKILDLDSIGHCSDLSKKFGANPCLENSQMSKEVLELLRILKRKNEKGDSLIKEMLSWLHPEGGVLTKTEKNQSRKLHTNIKEVVSFIFDLSSEKTRKSFKFYENGKGRTEFGTVLERLEIVIRDISFLNNFYGAYFKNTVAKADNYKKEIEGSKKLLTFMEKSGPVLRGIGLFPQETKSKLKNIRATYDSLAEVADEYSAPDGSKRSYGSFIQGLLSTIQNSSLLKTQNFNPYRKPEEEIVNGHNGTFLTKVVQMSGLRHMARILREGTKSEMSLIASQDFKKINQHLIARHDLETLQKGFQSFLDKYLDSSKKELNLFVDDLFYFMSKISYEDQVKIAEIFSKLAVVLSSPEIETKQIYKIASFFEQFIHHWPKLRVYFYKMNFDTSFLDVMNQALDHIISHPREFNLLWKELSSALTTEEFSRLILDENLILSLRDFLQTFFHLNKLDSDLNWHETFKKILANKNVSWSPLAVWLRQQEKDKLSLSLLIKYLGEKENQTIRWKTMMDELFLNHRDELNQFINKTFIYLELKPD